MLNGGGNHSSFILSNTSSEGHVMATMEGLLAFTMETLWRSHAPITNSEPLDGSISIYENSEFIDFLISIRWHGASW